MRKLNLRFYSLILIYLCFEKSYYQHRIYVKQTMGNANQLLTKEIQSHSKEKLLVIDFNREISYESLNLSDLKLENRSSKDIFVQYTNCIGFNLMMQKPIIFIDSWPKIKLSIKFFFFRFDIYKISKLDQTRSIIIKLNQSSTRDLLKNYYDLNSDLDPISSNRSFLTALFDNFTSMFMIGQPIFIKIPATSHLRSISKLLFKNANILELKLFIQVNTTLRRYFVEFKEDFFLYGDHKNEANATTINFKLNSSITYISLLDCYNIQLSKQQIDLDTLLKVNRIHLSGSFSKFDEDLFNGFKLIARIYLSLNNYRELIHSTSDNNKWMKSMNSESFMDLSRFKSGSNYPNRTQFKFIKDWKLILEIEDRYDNYEYPNHDLCLFRHFPHNQLVFLATDEPISSNSTNLLSIQTCTLLHLTKYWFFANSSLSIYLPEKHSMKENIENECNFTILFSMCHTAEFRQLTTNEITMDDFHYFLEWFDFIGPIITFPIVSAVGILTNILILIVIKSKKNTKIINETENTTRMFNYLAINSVLNIIECLICVFTLMSECMGSDSVFCSSITTMQTTIEFKIYIVGFLGESLKTCSVILMLLFSLERYKVTASIEKSKILNYLANKKLKIIVITSFAFSLLTSVTKIFEYTDAIESLGSPQIPDLFIKHLLEDPNKKIMFMIIYLIHYLLNDALFLSLNFIVDILLVIHIRKALNQKKLLLKKLNHKNNQEKYNCILKAEHNTNKMLIYTFIMYIICRFPELVLYIFLIIPDYDSNKSRFHRLVAPSAISVVQYLYVLAYTTNIFFYFKFNKLFQRSLKNIL